ncbi:MAG TPA: tripartite tricarboxylate transporter TctB family protein [Clostridiaceae bacterium]|nr:tripartite tricarboxylate transporter TctB family protein [Clostridiaceae bacterium]
MVLTDLISGIVMLLISIYVYVSALSFPIAEYQQAGPAFYPQIMAVGLAIVSVILILRSIKRLKNGEMGPEVIVRNPKLVLAAMLATVLYVLVLKTLGFIITTFLYLAALVILMRPEKKMLINLVIAAVMTLAVYAIFAGLFSASLPRGTIFS